MTSEQYRASVLKAIETNCFIPPKRRRPERTAVKILGYIRYDLGITLFTPDWDPSYRAVDRTLRTLRKEGRITYDRTEGWSLMVHAK